MMNNLPWSEETINNLNASQEREDRHPYTCGKNSDHILIATAEGWKCPECGYTQDWY